LIAGDLDHSPSLLSGKRAALFNAHTIANLTLVLGVVSFELLRASNLLLVLSVCNPVLNGDNHRLIHFVGHDFSD
jgi:hypothetical protein